MDTEVAFEETVFPTPNCHSSRPSLHMTSISGLPHFFNEFRHLHPLIK